MAIRYKRENWKGRYYLVRRRKDGSIISRRRYVYKKKEEKVIKRKVKKRIKRILTPQKRIKNSIIKQSTVKTFSKRIIKDKVLLSRNTGINEIETRKIVRRKRGVMQIKFIFFKEKRKAITVTSRSNKMLLTSESGRRMAFNQCYQRALAQITFSPRAYGVKEITYLYWETGV